MLPMIILCPGIQRPMHQMRSPMHPWPTVRAVLIATVMMLPLAAQTPRIHWTRQFGANAHDQTHAVGYGEFGVPQVLSTSLAADGTVVRSLGGTRILVNNIPAPILYSISSQVAIQIPFELAGQTIALVVAEVGGQFSEGRGIG